MRDGFPQRFGFRVSQNRRLTGVCCALLWAASGLWAQATSTSVSGSVTDPSGAIVRGARVVLRNPTSGFHRRAVTGASGHFRFYNVPLGHYQLSVRARSFSESFLSVTATAVPVQLAIPLRLATAGITITVHGAPVMQNTPVMHTVISRQLFKKIPLESASSSLSSLVTLAAPGVTADSNGLFHGMGDHASNSFSIDGQPVTDQQSKVFSNQLPTSAIQTLKVIEGAPPAQYGDKTSLIIVANTRSGQGVAQPHGDIHLSYGSFGSSAGGFDLGYGGSRWGNFITLNGLNTGRFLDPPQFTASHDQGNEENLFDRVDYQWSNDDLTHVEMGYTRSWFQTPNAYDNLHIGMPGLGPTNQSSYIQTVNFAPTWVHIFGPSAILTTQFWYRRDGYHYNPSPNPFADLGPPSLQRETIGQYRTLANIGAHVEYSWTNAWSNLLLGAMLEHTLLNENDNLGVVDPTLNAPCLSAPTAAHPNAAVAGFTNPDQCAAAGDQPNLASNPNAPGSALYPYFNPVLLPYDLTRGGVIYPFTGQTDIKETALYAQDDMHFGNWGVNLGLRGDFYNGLTAANQAEPRLGVSYRIQPTNTILSLSYARTLQTPFNENLIVASEGCAFPVLNPLLGCVSNQPTEVLPGYRNSYYAGLQQEFGHWVVINGEYEDSYTTNAYDFSVLGNTPITFPIVWAKSKVPGIAVSASVLPHHGVTAYVNMSHVLSRFYTPQVGGAGANPLAPSSVFRIDHDEAYNLTTHIQYQFGARGPWLGFNWRFDSGLVAGATPCYGIGPANNCPGSVLINGVPNISMIVANAGNVPMTAAQEYEGGFYCGSLHATTTQALPFNCPASEFGSTLINIPAPGTENADLNPARIKPRNLFDLAIGDANFFHIEQRRVSITATIVNLDNQKALFNYLSTFSGTHYVSPRSFTLKLGYHF